MSSGGRVDWSRRGRIADSILDAAGLTPLVRLRRVVPESGCEVLVKVEYFGPSGSVKDRILPHIVAEAERRGDLRPGMTLIEGTTGNTGIATAMVGAAKGYPVIIVMPEGMSEERKKAIRAYGAELVLTPGAESDVDLVLEKVAEIKRDLAGRVFEVGQFANRDNPEAHYATTGPEVWEQTGGRLDAFVAAQGTGGTLSGVARYLKEQDPRVAVFAVEPSECAVLSGGGWGAHRIEGIGDGIIPEVLDIALLDGVVQVSSEEAIAAAQRLAREEGLFCGISSGCNVAACLKLAAARPGLRRLVTTVNDHGFRYFSTELCGAEVDLAVPERDHPIEFDAATRERLARLAVVR
jgi:cysteine synthase A